MGFFFFFATENHLNLAFAMIGTNGRWIKREYPKCSLLVTIFYTLN